MPINNNPLSSNELQRMLQSYQSGVAEDAATTDASEIQLNPDNATTQQSATAQRPTLYQSVGQSLANRTTVRNYTEEALAQGFGKSRYDRRFQPGENIEDVRAREQPGIARIGAGIMGGVGNTIGTAINSTVGIVDGVVEGAVDLIFDPDGNGRGFKKTIDAGVDNWTSNQMVKFHDYVTELFPRYRTDRENSEEYQRQWLKPSHFFSSNSIADFLDNFGFTAGAMLGGAAVSKGISKAMGKQFSSDILKAAILGAEGDEAATKALKEASAAMQAGSIGAAQKALARAGTAIENGRASLVDADKVLSNVHDVAKRLNSASARLQLYGSVISAIGEGTSEGINAKNEFLEDFNNNIQQAYALEYNSLENEILNSGNKEWVLEGVVRQPDGSTQIGRALTPEGQQELLRRQKETVAKYNGLMHHAELEGRKLAGTVELLNIPILTASNMFQFGRMFSGGWKTERAINKVGGKLLFDKNAIKAAYKKKGTVFGKTVLNSLKIAGSEGSEEILQGIVSSGAKQVAEDRLSAFNDAGYDEESITSFRNGLASMVQGGIDYVSDIKNWQEFAAGALTGLLGIPGKHWNGGIIGAAQDAKAEVNDSQKAADKLNALVNSEDFQNKFRGFIRNMKYGADKQRAVDEDNQYAWHSADSAQMINAVMLFADTGRINDLEAIVDRFGHVTDTDVQDIRDMAKDKDGNPEAWIKNLSDDAVKEKVQKQAGRIKEKIEEYRNIYDDLSARLPIGSSPELLKELIFTASQINAFDKRFMQMFGETMEAIEPYLSLMSALDEEGNFEKDKDKQTKNLETIRNFYEKAFGQSIVPIDYLPTIKKRIKDALDYLERTTSEDKEVNQKVKDMRRLTEDRQKFYLKLETLMSEDGQKKMQETAVTQEKVNEAAAQAGAVEDTKNEKSMNEVSERFLKSNATERAKYLSSLQAVKDKDKAAADFLDLYDTYSKVDDFLKANSTSYLIALQDLRYLLENALHYAKGKDEFLSLPQSILGSKEDYELRHVNTPTALLPNTAPSFDEAIKVLQQIMADYKAKEAGKNSAEALSKSGQTSQQAPVAPETKGPDPANPGSMSPEPPSQDGLSDKTKRAVAQRRAKLQKAGVEVVENINNIQSEEPVAGKVYASVTGDKEGNVTVTFRRTYVARDGSLRTDDSNVGAFIDDAQIYDLPKQRVILTSLTYKADKAIVGDVYVWNTDEGKYKKSVGVVFKVAPLSSLSKDQLSEAEKATLANPPQIDNENPPSGENSSRTEQAEELIGNSDEIAESEGSDDEDVKTETYDQTQYLRTSVPEIDSWQASAVRDAIRKKNVSAFKAADLSDFVLNHPEYAETWHALAEAGAFDYVANNLKVGDELEFIIDPNFPMYEENGKKEPQILVTTKVNGKRQLLTVLSRQTKKYAGLGYLRIDMMNQYNKFHAINKTDVFVFNKKSRVWAKRPGLIEYKWKEGEKGAEDRSITEIPCYSEDYPIAYINREGNAVVINGKGDPDAVNHVSLNFNNAELNKKESRALPHGLRGRMYLLVPAGDNKHYIPVRLGVKHFTIDNMNDDNEVFEHIREIVKNIESLCKHLHNGETDITGTTHENNIDVQNAKLRKQLAELRKWLDCRYDYYEFGYYNNIGLAIKRHNNDPDAKDEHDHFLRPDQMTGDRLLRFFAEPGRAVQIRQVKKKGDNGKIETDANGQIENIDTIVSSGILTSNAVKLRAKGVDFYYNTWDEGQQAFAPLTQKQVAAEQNWRQEQQRAREDAERQRLAQQAQAEQQTQQADEQRQQDVRQQVVDQLKAILGEDHVHLSQQEMEDYLKANGLGNLSLANETFSGNGRINSAANGSLLSADLQNSITTGEWNEASINELNNLIKDIQDGKARFNNLSKEENVVAGRDRLLAAAGIQARGNGSASEKESQDERNERQEGQVEAWAKREGVWHDDALAYGKSFGEELPGGQESHVYENPSNGAVIKVKNTLQYHDLQEFLDGIVLHNNLFPETAYKVLGFGSDGEGFVAILEQPFVRGAEPTQQQITEFLKERVPDAEMYEESLGNGRYKTSQTLLHDLSPRNAIITANGNIAIIDDIIRPNVAAEGKGGQRSEDYSISISPANETGGTQESGKLQVNTATDVQEYKTPSGEVYGFVTPNGDVYLDSNVITSEHPIHEYTHLWDRAVMDRNPELWKRGVELMKQTKMWKTIENSMNYGKKWKEAGKTGDALDNLIASEVHARLVSKNGAANLDKISKEKGGENIIQKLKDWLLSVWKEVAQTFGHWTKQQLDSLTLNDFNRMTVRDFVNATPLTATTSQSSVGTESEAKQTINIYASANEHSELSNFADRPFDYKLSQYISAKDGSGQMHVKSVEHAFQAMKFLQAIDPKKDKAYNQTLLTYANNILKAATAAEAKKLGSKKGILKQEDIAAWDNMSEQVMHDLIKASFEQNEEAKQALLDTGDAILTHMQDRTKWKEAFPRILMQVRSELKEATNVEDNADTGFGSDDSFFIDLDPDMTNDAIESARRLEADVYRQQSNPLPESQMWKADIPGLTEKITVSPETLKRNGISEESAQNLSQSVLENMRNCDLF